MAYENSAGINVHNHYGVRETGGDVGIETGKDSVKRLSITITGAMLNGTFVPPVVLPKGALVQSYRLRVDEAFVVSTGGTVDFGSEGSETTNGVTLTEAELENVGTKTPASTGNGTWAVGSSTGLAAAAKVNFEVTGTVGATSGKATLIVEYFDKAKA